MRSPFLPWQNKRKLQNLLKISSNNVFGDSHNPERVLFTFSMYELTDNNKNTQNWLKTQNFYYLLSYYSAT